MKQKRVNTVLGLGYVVFHDSNIALTSSTGSVIFACSEERLSRKKHDGSIPVKALARIANQIHDNTPVVCAYYDTSRYMELYDHHDDRKLRLNKRHTRILKDLGVSVFLGHHFSHAAGAYYTSGFTDAYVITYDGGISCEPWFATLWKGEQGQLFPLRSLTFADGARAALHYSVVTALLGFAPARDEGKVTGLAAHGTVQESCVDALAKAFSSINHEDAYYSLLIPGVAFPEQFLRVRQRFSDEDIAASIQYMTETDILAWITHVIDNISEANCLLSGGLFANVKLNQKIKELGFKNVYVYPAMGDEGLGLGAALGYLARDQLISHQLAHVYLGPSYTPEDLEKALVEHDLFYQYYAAIEEKIAELLAAGSCVARFDGALEFGPRALGNRSILYQATDPNVNNWLNKHLLRTEFMPFAPATLVEHADICYENLKGLEQCTKFMTVTVSCTEKMKRLSPAVVHIDGTARPQIVDQEVNPGLYCILKAYYERTGIPSLINTSFNMHGEPIVCSPDDAIRSFVQGKLDYLALGNFLVARDGCVAKSKLIC